MFQLTFSKECFRGKKQVYTFLETLSIGDVNIVLWTKLKYVHGGAGIYSLFYKNYTLCEVC